MLLEDLQAQVAVELGRGVRASWLAFFVNGVNHAKEVSVHLAERNQVLRGELPRQVGEDVVTWNYLRALRLARPETEALRCLNWRVLRLQVPLEQEGEASRDGLLQKDLLLDEGEEAQSAQPWQSTEVTRLVSALGGLLTYGLGRRLLRLVDCAACSGHVRPGRGL